MFSYARLLTRMRLLLLVFFFRRIYYIRFYNLLPTLWLVISFSFFSFFLEKIKRKGSLNNIWKPSIMKLCHKGTSWIGDVLRTSHILAVWAPPIDKKIIKQVFRFYIDSTSSTINSTRVYFRHPYATLKVNAFFVMSSYGLQCPLAYITIWWKMMSKALDIIHEN